MNKNAKQITTIAILIAITSSIATYAWNNQTLSEMVEEHNQQILSDCLTKARVQKTAKEILEYASNCNKDILTNISTPRSVETITGTGEISCPELYYSGKTIESPRNGVTFYFTKEEVKELYPDCKIGTHSTGNTVPPLGFQLIPTAETKSVESASKELQIKNTKVSTTHSTIGDTNTGNVRTPKQLYEQVNCNTECKIETITKLGINSNIAILIVSECKEGAIDPVHCIIVASSIVINESGGGKSNACVNRFNCFGFGLGKIKYTSYQESVANFVNTYSRKWYKAKNSSFFYPDKGEYSPSRYCVSEQSSNSEIGCPFGQKHMQNTWNKLDKLF